MLYKVPDLDGAGICISSVGASTIHSLDLDLILTFCPQTYLSRQASMSMFPPISFVWSWMDVLVCELRLPASNNKLPPNYALLVTKQLVWHSGAQSRTVLFSCETSPLATVSGTLSHTTEDGGMPPTRQTPPV